MADYNRSMKNSQVIDGALNSVYDVFATTDEEFALIFPDDQDVAFIDAVVARGPERDVDDAFERIWQRRIPKREAVGIHGLLFYDWKYRNIFIQPEKMRRHAIVTVQGFDSLSIARIPTGSVHGPGCPFCWMTQCWLSGGTHSARQLVNGAGTP